MAHVSGDPARAFGDPLALLLNPRLRRCVILQRREDFVAFGLCVLELEAERTRSGQASLWPEFEDSFEIGTTVSNTHQLAWGSKETRSFTCDTLPSVWLDPDTLG
jgi:hypothetical protein